MMSSFDLSPYFSVLEVNCVDIYINTSIPNPLQQVLKSCKTTHTRFGIRPRNNIRTRDSSFGQYPILIYSTCDKSKKKYYDRAIYACFTTMNVGLRYILSVGNN